MNACGLGSDEQLVADLAVGAPVAEQSQHLELAVGQAEAPDHAGGPRVRAAIEDDPADENYKLLRESRRRLETMINARGEPLRIIDLPMPEPVIREGQRLPASYANFYIANEVVLLPVFGHRNDERARAIVQECFPTRRVVPMDSRDLIWGLGSFHCVTQQQPA